MAIETEIKLKISNLDTIRDKLKKLSSMLTRRRYFEDNIIFDYPNDTLKSKGYALRLRFVDDGCYLTFKGPAKADSHFKVREEIETKVEDGLVMFSILERLGLLPSFRYQKYRTEYLVSISQQDVTITIDETPMGNFLELEGPEELIVLISKQLGYTESAFIKSTYLMLYKNYCDINNLPFGDMVFPQNPIRGSSG